MLPILSSLFRSLEPANMFASLRRDVDRLFDEAWSGPPGTWRTRGWLPPVDWATIGFVTIAGSIASFGSAAVAIKLT